MHQVFLDGPYPPTKIVAGGCMATIAETKLPRGQNHVRVTSDAHTVSAPFPVLFGVSVGYDPPHRTPRNRQN